MPLAGALFTDPPYLPLRRWLWAVILNYCNSCEGTPIELIIRKSQDFKIIEHFCDGICWWIWKLTRLKRSQVLKRSNHMVVCFISKTNLLIKLILYFKITTFFAWFVKPYIAVNCIIPHHVIVYWYSQNNLWSFHQKLFIFVNSKHTIIQPVIYIIKLPHRGQRLSHWRINLK